MVIVAERLLREPLLKLLRTEGAAGHSMIAIGGEGSRGVNAGDLEGRNAPIGPILSAKGAERVLNRIPAEYLENHTVIAYTSDVEVLRGDKFAGGG